MSHQQITVDVQHRWHYQLTVKYSILNTFSKQFIHVAFRVITSRPSFFLLVSFFQSCRVLKQPFPSHANTTFIIILIYLISISLIFFLLLIVSFKLYSKYILICVLNLFCFGFLPRSNTHQVMILKKKTAHDQFFFFVFCIIGVLFTLDQKTRIRFILNFKEKTRICFSLKLPWHLFEVQKH